MTVKEKIEELRAELHRHNYNYNYAGEVLRRFQIRNSTT